MQLKIKRSQHVGGMINKSVVFAIDARAELTPEEIEAVRKYKLENELLYESDKANELRGRFQEAGMVSSLVLAARHRLSLTIVLKDLVKGKHIECKDLAEIISTEEAVRDACNSLVQYLRIAEQFDGGEEIIAF